MVGGPSPAHKDVEVYIKGVCAREGISLAELGRRAGISKFSLTRKLKGQRTATLVNVADIAEALEGLGESVKLGSLIVMFNKARSHYLEGRNV